MTTIAGAVLLISTLSFWGGLFWLVVTLFRKKSVKPPLGAVLLGMVLFPLGVFFVLSDISFIPDALQDSESREPSAAAVALNQYLRVELTDMYLKKADLLSGSILDRINFTFRYENVGDVDIRAFTGRAAFFDLFDRPIKTLSLTYEESIGAGEFRVDRDKGFEPNQFIESDQKLMTTDLQDLSFRFELKSILFADGTRIGDPQ